MTRPRAALACLVVLLTGAVAGWCLTGGPGGSRAEAQNYRYTEVDRTYQELTADRGPLVTGGERLARIAKLVMPSVVHIQSVRDAEARGGRIEETGSGVLLTSHAVSGPFVVTNRHVVADARREDIAIHLHNGRVLRPTRVLTDEATDLAVLSVDATGVEPARWGDSDKLEIGHMVLALGSPFGLSQSMTLGIISAKGRRSLNLGDESAVLNQDFLQTDAAINPGNSGGPLIDLSGRVVAINTAIASNSGGNDGIGFSIPSNLVRQVVEQLLQHGRVQRAYLGVKLDPKFDAEVARRLRVGRVVGARVVEVYPDTPAARSQLRFDDVILKFEETEVQDENHLINLVSLTPVGRRVTLEVLRDGRRQQISVLLADREELSAQGDAPAPQRRPVRSTRPAVRPQGLTLHALDGNLSQQLGFDEGADGLIVMSVDRQHPLSGELGLYDVIVEAARRPLRSVEDWDDVLSGHAGGPLLLKVRRRDAAGTSERLVLWSR